MEKRIDYLRLSVTDRCNLNCFYCTPLEKAQFLTHNEVLRYEEMVRIVSAFVTLGVRNVRITGGEPLIKRDIASLIKMLKEIKGLQDLAMTTNGVYLKDMARPLKVAGLDRVNISLDTLKKENYISVTGGDYFEDVWSGIVGALEVGLHPVKLNVVVVKGVNDDEISEFVRLALRYPLHIRFIEFFPTSKRSEEITSRLIKTDEVKKKIVGHFGEMKRAFGIKGNGPAEYYKLRDSKGLIGFISGFSGDFCNRCNRVRVDCGGKVSPCLFSGYICELLPVVRSGGADEELFDCIKEVFEMKTRYNKNTMNGCKIEMSNIGG